MTIAVTLVFAALIAAAFAFDQLASIAPFPLWLVLVAAYATVFLFRPLAYELTVDRVFIRRPIGKIAIHRRRIVSAELLGKHQMRWMLRLFGVGGLFGYFGKCANKNVGRLTLYATREDRTVLIRTVDGRGIILTPDEPELFIRRLRDGR